MRKDPEKKQAGKERRKKRTCGDHFHLPFHRCGDYCNCRTIAYTMTNQLPQDEKQVLRKGAQGAASDLSNRYL